MLAIRTPVRDLNFGVPRFREDDGTTTWTSD
jgi:hypothetical protein